MDNKTMVYVGSWGNVDADGEGKGITVLSFDDNTGEMRVRSLIEDIPEPSVLTVSRDSGYLYTTNELMTHDGKLLAGGCVTALKINQKDGSLIRLNTVPSMGAGPVYCKLDPSGKYLAVTNHGTIDGITKFARTKEGRFYPELEWDSSTLAIFPVNSDGSLSEACDVYTFEGIGSFMYYKDDPARADRHYPGGHQAPYEWLQLSPHAHSVQFFGNGYGVVCERGTDSVYLFEIDSKNNSIRILDHMTCEIGSGPRHSVTHPKLPVFYFTNELENTVTAFGVDFAGRRMKEIQTIATLEDGCEAVNAPSDITISRDGRYIYAGNRGHNSIAVFRADPETGLLERIQVKELSKPEPRGFAISPDGRFLVVGNKKFNTVTSLSIDSESGMLSDTGYETEVITPTCIRFARLA